MASATEKLIYDYLETHKNTLNIAGLADVLDVSRATLNHFQSGLRPLSKANQQKFIAYLNAQAQALAELTTQLNG